MRQIDGDCRAHMIEKARKALDAETGQKFDELEYRLRRVLSPEQKTLWIEEIFYPVVLPKFCNDLGDRGISSRTAAATVRWLFCPNESLGSIARALGLTDASDVRRRISICLPVFFASLANTYEREQQWLREDSLSTSQALNLLEKRIGRTRAVAFIGALMKEVRSAEDYAVLATTCELQGWESARRFYLSCLHEFEMCVHEAKAAQEAMIRRRDEAEREKWCEMHKMEGC